MFESARCTLQIWWQRWELEELRRPAKESKAHIESYDGDISSLRASLEQEKTVRKKENASLEEAKTILISQKMQLQNNLDEMAAKIKTAEATAEETISNAANVQQMLREENSNLQSQLVS